MPTVAVGRTREPGRRVQADQLPVRRHVLQVFFDQDGQVFVVDFLLLVGQGLEVVEQRLELFVGQACSPSRSTRSRKAWRPECLPRTRSVRGTPTSSGRMIS